MVVSLWQEIWEGVTRKSAPVNASSPGNGVRPSKSIAESDSLGSNRIMMVMGEESLPHSLRDHLLQILDAQTVLAGDGCLRLRRVLELLGLLLHRGHQVGFHRFPFGQIESGFHFSIRSRF